MRFIFVLLFCCINTVYYMVAEYEINKPVVTSAITYELNGGRFGDNLLSYSRAKWLSYSYKIPLLVLPFPYYDQLQLYDYERIYTENDKERFNHIIRFFDVKELKSDSDTLYVNHWYVKVPINWNDPVFVNQLKTMIAPKYDTKLVSIPEGYLSVAVHVRRGGGFAADTEQEKERCPLRFVPDEFFIAQIDRIADLFPDQKLYVYIFTDDKNPKKLADKFAQALNNDRITFAYQTEESGHNVNVLEDFFSMMQFDCLIRPGSHFSRFVERLGNAKLSIYPHSVRKVPNQPAVIDVIGIKTRTAKGWKTEKVVIA